MAAAPVVLPGSDVVRAVQEVERALAFSLAVLPLALVALVVWVELLTSAVLFVILPLALVERVVCTDLDALAAANVVLVHADVL